MKQRVFAKAAAFTLIELLVVISIIAVLIGLVVSVTGKVLGQADSTKCVNNLRQIGAAIGSYTQDNDDFLPGPLHLAQTPIHSADDKGSLPRMLERYLSLTPRKGSGAGAVGGGTIAAADRANPFICPAYEKEFKDHNGVVYAMNMQRVQDYGQSAWGKEGTDERSLKKAALTTWRANTAEGTDRPVRLSEVFAMKDTDAEDKFESGESLNSDKPAAKKPVHKDHRNALFFDMHVGKIRIEDDYPLKPIFSAR